MSMTAFSSSPLSTLPRSSGILLHPTSLPGRFGQGDLGPEAHRFVQRLADAGQTWWQMLPIGPVGFGGSPYQSTSSWAGDLGLISPIPLHHDGLVNAAEVDALVDQFDDPTGVDYPKVAKAKGALLSKAYTRFDNDDEGFHHFCRDQSSWLDDYALFMALKEHHDGQAWNTWPEPLAARKPEALAEARDTLARPIDFQRFVQYQFERQWSDLRATCRARNVRLIGDLPIFVAFDSADVWANRHLFRLDKDHNPTHVAGVPPDYFCETGQLWGNPVYNWPIHERDGFAWWAERVRGALRRVDLIRLDHFRGFDAYWAVPFGEPTAVNGTWEPTPGEALLTALRLDLGGLPLIAEDLGEINDDVEALRDRHGLPGMRVLQFAFGHDPKAYDYLPHNFVPHCVAYTGTHDNDTLLSWFATDVTDSTQPPEEIASERRYIRRYLDAPDAPPEQVVRGLIRLLHGSVADLAIVPLQDLLVLGNDARMNRPGTAQGNWAWRVLEGQISDEAFAWLADVTAAYARWNGIPPHDLQPPYQQAQLAGVKPHRPPETTDDDSAANEGLPTKNTIE